MRIEYLKSVNGSEVGGASRHQQSSTPYPGVAEFDTHRPHEFKVAPVTQRSSRDFRQIAPGLPVFPFEAAQLCKHFAVHVKGRC